MFQVLPEIGDVVVADREVPGTAAEAGEALTPTVNTLEVPEVGEGTIEIVDDMNGPHDAKLIRDYGMRINAEMATLDKNQCRMREVGTTNRTRVADFRAAIGDATGLLLNVHPSNYRVVGFTESVPLAELEGLLQDRDGAPGLLASLRKAFPWLRHLFADGLHDLTGITPGVLRVLMIGDAIGKPGRQTLEREAIEKGKKALVHIGFSHTVTCHGERLGTVLTRTSFQSKKL